MDGPIKKIHLITVPKEVPTSLADKFLLAQQVEETLLNNAIRPLMTEEDIEEFDSIEVNGNTEVWPAYKNSNEFYEVLQDMCNELTPNSNKKIGNPEKVKTPNDFNVIKVGKYSGSHDEYRIDPYKNKQIPSKKSKQEPDDKYGPYIYA